MRVSMNRVSINAEQLDKQLAASMQKAIEEIPGAVKLEYDQMEEKPFRLLVTPEVFGSTFRDTPVNSKKIESGNYHLTALTEKVKVVTVMSEAAFKEFCKSRQEEIGA